MDELYFPISIERIENLIIHFCDVTFNVVILKESMKHNVDYNSIVD